MKKNLFTVLLALTLAVPAFANQKGDMEVLGKLGLTLTPKVDCSGSFVDKGGFTPTHSGKSDTNMSFLITAEFFYYLNNSFAIGCGINNNFNADLKDTKEHKGEVGFTNFYLALKPKIELNSETFNSLYFIGQLGYGIFRFNNHKFGKADGNGLYWGLGAGTEVMKNFVVELLYSFNYGSLKDNQAFGHTANLTYSTLSLNIGYKFAL